MAASFTYDPTTDRGRVRQLMAATKQANAGFTGEEIDAALAHQGSVEGACYDLAAFMYSHALRHTSARTHAASGQSKTIDDTHSAEGWKALMDHYKPFASSSTRMPAVKGGVPLTPSSDAWTRS